MAIPKGTEIPKSSGQFTKLEEGVNKLRVLSDVVIGWEGWKNQKPFRHEGAVCKIKPEDVDLNKNGKPNINYFWAMIVWNYQEKRVQVYEVIQKTIMSALYDLESNPDWGDIKGYDISITKKGKGTDTEYTVLGIPPKPLSDEIIKAYEESDCDLAELFKGGYPMGNEDITAEFNDDGSVSNVEDIPFS